MSDKRSAAKRPAKQRWMRLDRNGRGSAERSARASVRGIIGPEPSLAGFDWRAVDWGSVIPRVIIYLILFVIGIIAFLLSAGKQLIAGKRVFLPLSATSHEYAESGPYLLLMFSEINSIFFTGIAHSIPEHMVGQGKLRFNLSAAACYVWAVVCAMFALVGNITVSLQHWTELGDVAALATLETLAPPLAALWIGWVGEQLWRQWATARAAAKRTRLEAHANWVKWNENPETHPQWRKRLQDTIIAELYKYPGNRELLEEDRPMRVLAYNVELQEMSELLEHIDVAAVLSNPTIRPTEVSQAVVADSTSINSLNSKEEPMNFWNVSPNEPNVAG